MSDYEVALLIEQQEEGTYVRAYTIAAKATRHDFRIIPGREYYTPQYPAGDPATIESYLQESFIGSWKRWNVLPDLPLSIFKVRNFYPREGSNRRIQHCVCLRPRTIERMMAYAHSKGANPAPGVLEYALAWLALDAPLLYSS